MSNAAKAHEPTMEEILASIRRIIADDEPAPEAKPAAAAPKAAAPAAAAAKPAPAPPAAAEEAAMELGQDDIDAMLASFDSPAVPAKEEPKPAAKEEDVLELTKPVAKPASEQAEVEFREPAAAKAEPEPEMDAWAAAEAMEEEEAAPPPPPPPAFKPIASGAFERHVGETLLAPEAGDAVSSAFSSLAHTILAQNARTLDDLVQEMLRPMLKSWLDDNLPTIVERLVRAEIERVSRGPRR
jgi:cell pole-organizing protein PopZ